MTDRTACVLIFCLAYKGTALRGEYPGQHFAACRLPGLRNILRNLQQYSGHSLAAKPGRTEAEGERAGGRRVGGCETVQRKLEQEPLRSCFAQVDF